jgi:hypothetical protein
MKKLNKLFSFSEVLPGVFAVKISRFVFVDMRFLGIKWTKIRVLGYDLGILAKKEDAVAKVLKAKQEYLLAAKYLRK